MVCRAGDGSLHTRWLSGKNRNFDIYISYFGSEKNKYLKDADFYEETKGPKWPILYKIISENTSLIEKYDAVWFPDDDLLMDTDGINRMFNLFSGFGLKLAQPALTVDSYVTHRQLIQSTACLLRYTNFIEVMAPIFSKSALRILGSTFNQSTSGWGLDYLWPILLEYRAMAIIDATPVIHTRPIGGELYKNNHLTPRDDISRLQELYPSLNLSKKFGANRLRFYGAVKKQSYFTCFARLIAAVTKWRNKIRYKKSTRFSRINER